MFFKTVFNYCTRIQNGRTIGDVLEAFFNEANELEDEIAFARLGVAPGEDGIIGEAVDTILCAMDVIHQANPELTEQEFMTVVLRKLDKWEEKYGNIQKV